MDKVLDKALTLEACQASRPAATSSNKSSDTSRRPDHKRKGDFHSSGQKRSKKNKCKNCGKWHDGECTRPVGCFYYHRPGHIKRQCPLLTKPEATEEPRKG